MALTINIKYVQVFYIIVEKIDKVGFYHFPLERSLELHLTFRAYHDQLLDLQCDILLFLTEHANYRVR